METASHPFIDSKDVKSETCLTCHPTKNQGKFVHSAVRLGCLSCHAVLPKDDSAIITLQATGGNLCAKCHAMSNEPNQHGPYASGECLACHNPHAGAYQAQTRAAVGTLCLGCHMLNQPGATVVAAHNSVSLFDGVTYDLTAWQSAPKITARHFEKETRKSDELTGRKPARGEAEINCLTCHNPHASKAEHLLRQGAPTRGATMVLPGARGGFSDASNGPWHVPELRGSHLGGQA